jgi:hypothetical protein
VLFASHLLGEPATGQIAHTPPRPTTGFRSNHQGFRYHCQLFYPTFLNNRLNIMQTLFRKNCLLCGAVSDGDLCIPCLDSLPELPPHRCEVCALPAAESRVCGACLANPPTFDRTIAALSYAFPVDALVHSLKYQGNLTMAPVLADLSYPCRCIPRDYEKEVSTRRLKSPGAYQRKRVLHYCQRRASVSKILPLRLDCPGKNARKIFKVHSHAKLILRVGESPYWMM